MGKVKELISEKLEGLSQFHIYDHNPFGVFGKKLSDMVAKDVSEIIGKPEFYIGYKMDNGGIAYMAVSPKSNKAFAVSTLKPVAIKGETELRNISEDEDVKFRKAISPILNEVVHHENEIKDGNRIENLRLFKNLSEHAKYHNDKRERECGRYA